MQSFLHAVRQTSYAGTDSKDSHALPDANSSMYSCLAPASAKLSQQVTQELAHLTGVHAFPGAHPTMLTSEDLWKLTQHPYKVAIRPFGLRMLLCFMTIDCRTVAVLVSENMMIVRATMSRVGFSMFRGSVFDGFVTIGEDGSVNFQVFDCLAFKGADASLNFHDSRYGKCAELVQGYQENPSASFVLELTPVHDADSREFYEMLQLKEKWHSVLYIPITRGVKKASAQSTLYQLGSLDIETVQKSLTEAILGDVASSSIQFSTWHPDKAGCAVVQKPQPAEAEAEAQQQEEGCAETVNDAWYKDEEDSDQDAQKSSQQEAAAIAPAWSSIEATVATVMHDPEPVKQNPVVKVQNNLPVQKPGGGTHKKGIKHNRRYGSFAPVPLQPAFSVPLSLKPARPTPDADGFTKVSRKARSATTRTDGIVREI